MFKRIHGLLLGIGVMLLLAGIVVLIRLDSAHAASASAERPRIVQAVVDLQGCFCHAVSAEAPLLAHDLDHAALLVANIASRPETAERAAVETRLVSAGQRILALPAASDEPAQVVTAGFLQIYAQTRLSDPTGETLAALDQLEFWLGMLENRAQTTRWNRAGSGPSLPDASAWQAVSLGARDYTAAFEFLEPWPDVVHSFVSLSDHHDVVRCADGVFDIHHRGPPAGAPYKLV